MTWPGLYYGRFQCLVVVVGVRHSDGERARPRAAKENVPDLMTNEENFCK